MRLIGRFLDRLASLAALVGIACVTLMMLHVTADVTGRYVFNEPISGTITIVANYYMVILGFVSLAVAETRNAHITVEVVSDLMPAGIQRQLGAMASLLGAGVFGLLTIRTWIEAVAKFEIGAAMQQGTVTIPIWPTYFAVPLGCGLMALVCLHKLVAHLLGVPTGFAETSPIEEGLHEEDDAEGADR